jgi:oligopeptidase B
MTLAESVPRPGLAGPRALQSVASAMPVPAPVAPVALAQAHVVSSPQGDRVDEYHWLRDDDPQAKRPEVMQHLQAENAYTAAMLAPLAGLQAQLAAEMRSRIQEDDGTPPVFDHGWWVWREYHAGAEYPRLMRQHGSPERPDPRAPPQLMLDQSARAAGHSYYKVGGSAVSPDGRILAWAEDTGGRRIHTLHFKNLMTGQVCSEAITGVLEDMAWANDNRSLFYIRQDPVTLQSGPVFRHVLGTPVQDDQLVYEEADKSLFLELGRTASGRFVTLVLHGTDTTETRVIPADRPGQLPRVVFGRRPGVRHSADHLHGRWILRTNEGALNFKLVSAPEGAPEVRSLWRTLVPARDEATLEDFVLLTQGIAVQERVEADTRVRLLSAGRSQGLPMASGTSVALGDNRDPRAAHLRFTLTSMVQPLATYDLHLARGETLLRKQQPVPGFDATRYATERLWAPARDGKRIPVTLAWRPDRARSDGTAPLLVVGYGAYGLSYDPEFSSHRVSLLDRGFVLAIAHVRGGAELGEAWYEDGRLLNKPNTFNDFVDATNALLAAGWGSPDKVCASGGSAGGLLMGVVANQSGAAGGRPYRAMVLKVPFVDVVTTMLDETIPLTANEWEQWGDPREPAAYAGMLAYSPYDNLAAQDYPAMLVTTGLWDSQVQYYEPAKYVARLRARKTDTRPLLLHVNMEAGHGGASGRFEALKELALEYAFLIDEVGLAGR